MQRWYFTLIGLLITLTLCGLAALAVPVKYQAKAQILVLPPHTSVGTGGNPYLALGGLQAASDVLARAMSDGKTFQLLRSEGITGTYTVARDLTTSGPILLVAADDSTPEGALSTLNGILAQAAPRLSRAAGRPERAAEHPADLERVHPGHRPPAPSARARSGRCWSASRAACSSRSCWFRRRIPH